MNETKITNFQYVEDKVLEESNTQSEQRNAWIFNRRKNNGTYVATLEEQMDIFRKTCETKGFRVIGGTFVEGDSREALSALKDFLRQEKDIQYILAPSIQALAHNVDEVIEAFEHMNSRSVILEIIYDGQLMNQKDNLFMLKQIREEIYAALNEDVEESKTDIEESNNLDSPQLSM